MRESRKGRSPLVSIGYKGKKENKKTITLYNLNDLENLKKEDVLILGKVGKKNKIKILKKAAEKNLNIQNINAERFLKKNEPK